MTRKTRTLIVLCVAVVTASLASLGVYAAVRRMPVRQVEVPSALVVVAAGPLEMGARVTAKDVRLVPWPAKSPVAGTFSKVEDVVDCGLVTFVGENEPLTTSKLAPLEAGVGLPPAIKPGMRAMSVKVNEVVGVAGFALPGTRVDVLATIRQEHDSATHVVVSNVQVLTAGTRYDESEAKKEGKAIPSTVVTLMVTPADAERIALAANEGQIMLALRNPLDVEQTKTAGIRTAALMSGTLVSDRAPAPPAAVRRPPRRPDPAAPVPAVTPAVYTVELIKGGKRDREIVR